MQTESGISCSVPAVEIWFKSAIALFASLMGAFSYNAI